MRQAFQFGIIVGYILILFGQDYFIMANRALAASPDNITLPSAPITFQAAPGSEIASSYCLICHSAEYIYMQPPHSRAQWDEIVNKMKQAFGCPIPEQQIPRLVDYLISQNAIQPNPQARLVEQGAPPQNNGKGNPMNGEVVYTTYCTNCHGRGGKGDGPIGQSLVPPAADLTITAKKSDKQLLKTIRKGRPGTAMPSWKGDLSDTEIQDVLSYVRTLAQ